MITGVVGTVVMLARTILFKFGETVLCTVPWYILHDHRLPMLRYFSLDHSHAAAVKEDDIQLTAPNRTERHGTVLLTP